MSTFEASVRVDGDTLTTSRPLTAPEPVGDMIDSVVYGMTSGGGAEAGVQVVELTITTSGESETPIADEVQGTSSQPIASSSSSTVDDESLA